VQPGSAAADSGHAAAVAEGLRESGYPECTADVTAELACGVPEVCPACELPQRLGWWALGHDDQPCLFV
jgi:hypothetical protein